MAKARKTSSDTIPSIDQSTDIRPDDRNRDRIAMRAYELFLARGGADGGDFDDWLAAERELGATHGTSARGDAGE